MADMETIYVRINWENSPSSATALGATNLNKMDLALSTIDGRVVTINTTKLDLSTANTMVQNVTVNEQGVFTITKLDGTTTTYDTKIEKIAVNFAYDEETQRLVLTLEDGTIQYVDLSSLVSDLDFTDSDTIDFTVTNGVVSAIVKNGSITGEKLQPNYLADVTVQAQNASNSASSALTSEQNASTSATMSRSYAVGDTATRPNETEDNAKYYYEQAKSIVISGVIDDTNPSTVKTYSSNKIEEKLGIINGSIDTLSYTVDTNSQTVNTHISDKIYTDLGVHGIRYFNDKLEYYNGTSWIDIETGGGGIAPSNVSNASIKVGNGKLTIKWSDPGNTVVDGQLLCTWKGTKLVQKAGSFPTNIKDGTVLLDNQVKDAYATNGFEINGLTNGTTYYFQLFPYSDKNAVNENVANRLSAAPQPFKTMTAIIDLSNSNPATCITYADDAVGMTPGSAAWDEFFGHYPCLLNAGVEVGKLKTTDYTKFENGTAADITSGSAGDVMVAFPRRGVKITTVGTTMTIKMTDDPDNADFEYLAHTRGSTRKEKFYLGAYKGYTASSKLRSLSGKTITATQTIGTFRTQAQANGAGYEQSGFYQLMFRQAMYLLKYKNLNSQVAVGRGYVDANSAAIATGGTNAKGMDFGETTGKLQMKLFGLEDFWGNIWEWIDGLVTNSTRNILTATTGFNNTGSGYTDQGQGATANIGNYMSKPQGTTKTGFIAKEVTGSATTYFCDFASLYASRVASFGGNWSDGSSAGAFRLDVYYSADYSRASIAARLMYL